MLRALHGPCPQEAPNPMGTQINKQGVVPSHHCTGHWVRTQEEPPIQEGVSESSIEAEAEKISKSYPEIIGKILMTEAYARGS